MKVIIYGEIRGRGAILLGGLLLYDCLICQLLTVTLKTWSKLQVYLFSFVRLLLIDCCVYLHFGAGCVVLIMAPGEGRRSKSNAIHIAC